MMKELASSHLSIQLRTISFLTGAGASTDSGVPDFQTIDRKWTFPVSRNRATSISYFKENPEGFWAAYRYLFDLKIDLKPNKFHLAVANLEKVKKVTVLTQNIDGLHSLAGSTNTFELHGNIAWAFCSRPSCQERKLLSELSDPAPRCGRCRKYLRPDVVLFGEEPREYQAARQAGLESGLMIVAGTALEVGPVNEIPLHREWYYPEYPTAWANKLMPPHGYHFTSKLNGPLGDFADLLNDYTNAKMKELAVS